MSSFFRGTSSAQDARFSDKEQKLYKTVKFPANFNTKVNMEKVNADVMHAWIANRLLELLGFEDEIVVEMVYEHLREKSPDPKLLHIHLSGFLQDKTTEFTSELWSLLISAQESLAGIPQRFIDEKKAEIRQTRNKESAAVDQFIERREQHLGLRGQDQIETTVAASRISAACPTPKITLGLAATPVPVAFLQQIQVALTFTLAVSVAIQPAQAPTVPVVIVLSVQVRVKVAIEVARSVEISLSIPVAVTIPTQTSRGATQITLAFPLI
ncbi:hypothetical protein RI367_000597 [Sorochytrium milnesiophthora]